jgi:hypothetical protein
VHLSNTALNPARPPGAKLKLLSDSTAIWGNADFTERGGKNFWKCRMIIVQMLNDFLSLTSSKKIVS